MTALAGGKLKNILQNRENPVSFKTKTINQCVLPVLTGRYEIICNITVAIEDSLQVAQKRIERRMIGVTFQDKKEVNKSGNYRNKGYNTKNRQTIGMEMGCDNFL